MNLNRRKFLKFILMSTGIIAIGKVLGFKFNIDEASASVVVSNIHRLHASDRLRIPVGTNMFS